MQQIGELKLDVQYSFDKQQRRVTVVQLFDKENKLLTRAKTTCSLQDNFSKKLGRKKAIKKALTKSSVSKEVRKNFWEKYRTSMTTKPRW